MTASENLRRLPAVERDILHLHQELRKSQPQVARILGVSQPTVNYRYKKLRARLDFLEQLPKVSSDEIRMVLERLGARAQDTEAMVLYIETSSQSEVARRMETSQGAVRYWVLRALTDHLQRDMREDDMHKRVRTACSMLIAKPGIFNEPKQAPRIPPKIERRLPAAPKFQGRLIEGEQIRIVDGLYGELDGELVEVTDDAMKVRLKLESQEITLSWPR